MSKQSKSEKFKARYKTDTLFRKNHKKSVAKYTGKVRKEAKEIRDRDKAAGIFWRKIQVGDKVFECCTIGGLGSSINRSPITIRMWERIGRLPPTFKYHSNRWYTKNHVDFIVRVWRIFGLEDTSKTLDIPFRIIRENWDSLYKGGNVNVIKIRKQ